MGSMEIHELLDLVKDKQTFLEFAKAMLEEAERAESLVRENPEKYTYVDPLGWAHLSASGVLGELYACVQEHPEDQPLTWLHAADFLYRAKVIE
jgi:hypothetical protein